MLPFDIAPCPPVELVAGPGLRSLMITPGPRGRPRLPADLLEEVTAGAPVLASDLSWLICTQIPEYADDPDGRIAREVNGAVLTAARSFVRILAGRARIDDVPVDVFERLGRLEALAGRSRNALQAAYRMAGLRVIERLVEWEDRFDVPRDVRDHVADVVTRFMDHLATLSAGGYEDGVTIDVRSAEARRHLLDLLLAGRSIGRHDFQTWSTEAGWVAPDVIRVLDLVPAEAVTDRLVAALGAALGPSCPAGRVADRALAVVAADQPLGEVASLLPPQLMIFAGPGVPLGELTVSARLARRAARRSISRPAAGTQVVDCNELLLELMSAAADDVGRVLARNRLAPLAKLSIGKRVDAAQLLAGWLEFGTLRAGGPGAVDVNRSTLRYRKARLEEAFGDALNDRDRRVELILALRWQLPRWEAELAMVQRRQAKRRVVEIDHSEQAGGAEVGLFAQRSEGNSS